MIALPDRRRPASCSPRPTHARIRRDLCSPAGHSDFEVVSLIGAARAETGGSCRPYLPTDDKPARAAFPPSLIQHRRLPSVQFIDEAWRVGNAVGAELRGDAELEVTGVKGFEEAGPTEVTFVANPRYTALARKTKAAAVLVEPEFQEISAATLRLKNPYLAFLQSPGTFLSTSGLLARHSPYGGH